ncbi:histidine--tRNA ligase [Pseudoglutamicibacter cumminsii]|uniref:Histidine--tRNA ligase n=1 Tax=Pseudoglutamicibacter cumminsii TaxID=156979 RepID=A0ABX5LAK4_9MICC|nr:histidine--tRNA ligase [Pseudoglutamicibacter cumminsii]PWI28740.1 histidine--tRNA ligase [Pseudoglutamicibacter cumminsii]
MSRKLSLTGFPEWLPQERIVENHVLDTLREVFELHGFSNIETRAVETVGTLLNKGEIDKEVYGVARLADDAPASTNDPNSLALHFDLTVPFARYVTDNAGYLTFPFRRYQIQKVWRGERPQDGRFREFTQADVDVVGDGELPLTYDLELALVMADALERLELGDFEVRVNNRKLSEGFYRGIGVEDPAAVLREIDKLEKIGAQEVHEALVGLGLNDDQATKALKLAEIKAADASFADQVEALGVEHELLSEGLAELKSLIEVAAKIKPGRIVADLSIARGLDYYTGTVYETTLIGHESLGSICSGGRYESLATKGKKNYPGVGLSIGVSRLVSRLLSTEQLVASRAVPTAVLMALPGEDDFAEALEVAELLRTRGVATEIMGKPEKFGKQIRHADRRGIPYVWFMSHDDAGNRVHEVKDIRSGEQVSADPNTWMPAETDLRPAVGPNADAS